MSDDEILFERNGAIAAMILNRPKALNALTHGVIKAFAAKLAEYAADDSVKAVILRGAGDRAFCAGGDVRAIRASVIEREGGRGPSELSKNFFYDEYVLNHDIHLFQKPLVSLWDGVTMGGGVGLSVHGSHRVATEKLIFAMPETSIGLFPDVGGGWFLPRCPGEVGMYLALTGDRLDPASALSLGIATNYVESAKVADLVTALHAADWDATGDSAGDAHAAVNKVLAGFETDPGAPPIDIERAEIDRCFSAPDVTGLMAALKDSPSEFCRKAHDTILHKSPTAVKVSFEQIRRGAVAPDFATVLTMEYRMSQHFMDADDIHEGIRAMLVDKDHTPKWNPPSLDEVLDAAVAGYFDAVEGRELTFS